MVDFTLTDEAESIQRDGPRLAEKEIRPVAWGVRQGKHLAAGNRREGLGAGVDEQPTCPTEYGGPGLGFSTAR